MINTVSTVEYSLDSRGRISEIYTTKNYKILERYFYLNGVPFKNLSDLTVPLIL